MRAACLCLGAALGLSALPCPTARSDEPSGPAATTSPSTRPVVVIEGQCVDALGSGVDGAKVVARRKEADGRLEYINTATTDKTGDFAIMAAGPMSGTAIVTITTWGFREHTAEVEMTPDESPPFVAAQLEGAVMVFGIVTDAATGKPVPDATVHVETGGNRFTTTAPADGRFRVTGLSPGPALVVVEAEGYGRAQHQVGRIEDFGELIMLLRPERVIRITTIDAEGKPIADVAVECVCPETDDHLNGMTNSNGEVIFRGVNTDARKCEVRLVHPDYVGSIGFDRKIEIPADQKESRHKMTLTRAGGVSGTVTDAESRTPVNGARVIVGDGDADAVPHAWSDFDGAYKVAGVPPGKTAVTVHLSGYAPDLKEVTAEAGKEARADFELRQAATLAGVVVDAQGKPVSGAHIGATRWRGHDTLGLQTLTDKQGRFTLTGAPPDEFTAAIACRGYAPLKSITLQGGKTDYRFELTTQAPDKTPATTTAPEPP